MPNETPIQKARLVRCEGCAFMRQGTKGIPTCDINVAEAECRNITFCGEWSDEAFADATAFLKEE